MALTGSRAKTEEVERMRPKREGGELIAATRELGFTRNQTEDETKRRTRVEGEILAIEEEGFA